MNAKSVRCILIIFPIFLCLNLAQGAEKKGGKTMHNDQKAKMSSVAVKRYDVESARIELETKGDFGHGRQTILFSDWGLHMSAITQEEGEKTKSITIVDSDFNYMFGRRGKDGYKSKIEKPIWHSDAGLDYSAWMARDLTAQGLKSAGETRVIAGKTCDVWKQGVMTQCFWKGVMLYFESSTPDGKQKSIIEAVKVDEHPTIARDSFTVPADIKFRNLEE